MGSLGDRVLVMLLTKTELVSPQQLLGESDHSCLGHIQFEVLKAEMAYREQSVGFSGEGLVRWDPSTGRSQESTLPDKGEHTE